VEILLGLIFGAVVGLAVHYALPHRDQRGALLAPLAGSAASGVSWAVLTWADLGAGTPVPWIVAIVAPAVTTLILVPVLARTRQRSDAAYRGRRAA
jgi:uncharacterized membrane protein YeaQ/YmgE (transglycosylase-associated protein family)